LEQSGAALSEIQLPTDGNLDQLPQKPLRIEYNRLRTEFNQLKKLNCGVADFFKHNQTVRELRKSLAWYRDEGYNALFNHRQRMEEVNAGVKKGKIDALVTKLAKEEGNDEVKRVFLASIFASLTQIVKLPGRGQRELVNIGFHAEIAK
jgi:hypothetical protein